MDMTVMENTVESWLRRRKPSGCQIRNWVDYSTFNAQPHDLDKALAMRKNRLQDVKIDSINLRPIACVEIDPKEHFIFNSGI